MGFSACNKNENESDYTNNLEVFLIDKEGTPIINTEIIVSGIDSTDIAWVNTTNDDGKLIFYDIGITKLGFSIVDENSSYTERYDLSLEELKSGTITVQFSKFEFIAQ